MNIEYFIIIQEYIMNNLKIFTPRMLHALMVILWIILIGVFPLDFEQNTISPLIYFSFLRNLNSFIELTDQIKAEKFLQVLSNTNNSGKGEKL